MEYNPGPKEKTTLPCCNCGYIIEPNPTNMCMNCIRNNVDITDGIQKNLSVNFCAQCESYLQPPSHWVQCSLESAELLSICLKKMKGLNKVKVIDAAFVWTEEHSRRLKVKLTVQKEVFNGAILQQAFVAEYIVMKMICPDCTRVNSDQTWNSVVQVRQKVEHKRTFMWMEQLILKHRAHQHTSNISDVPDGLDFYFGNRNHARKMLSFFQECVPVRYKTGEKLISHDIKNGTSNYKFTYCVDIAPVCRDDLIVLPPKAAQHHGGISPLVLCHKLQSSIQLIDPLSLQAVTVPGEEYWKIPFRSIMTVTRLTSFYVIDVDLLGPTNGKFGLADVTVAREADFGKNDIQMIVRSHLGHILNPGDYCLGYDIEHATINSEELEKTQLYKSGNLPDVILVKKHYPGYRKKKRLRN